MSEPAVIQTLAAWLETAGPKRCITWIAETCDEIAIRDIPTWRFWIEMGSLFRDIAAALPTYNELRDWGGERSRKQADNVSLRRHGNSALVRD